MKITFRENDLIATIHIGKRSVRLIQDELDALRRQCDQGLDILSSTPVFLANTARWNTFPVVVLMRKQNAPVAAVLLHGHTKYRVPTGILTAGHECGRGAIIAPEAQRPVVAEIAARVLCRSVLFHTVAIRLPCWDAAAGILAEGRPPRVKGHWLPRHNPSCISLDGGMEGLMARLSYKMRRNLRYYKRRAEKDLACIFIPQLSPEQSRQAVEVLSNRSTHPIATARALRYEAAQRDTPGSFAVGLRDGAGNWLSYLAGWRQDKTVYIVWQLNLLRYDTVSLSTVMRAYLLEHEIGRGSLQVIFVGGTSPMWSRACIPQVCAELLVVREGIVSAAARALGQRISPKGQMAVLHAKAAVGRSFGVIVQPTLEQGVEEH